MEVYENSSTVDPEVRAHVYSLVSAVRHSLNIIILITTYL
jgi:hypothetical protein